MPRVTTFLLALVLGAGSALLASCGGSDGPPEGAGIPAADADGMLAELERARAAFAAGDCVEVAESAQQISESAQNLADTLDPEVEEGLTTGAARLAELAETSSECEQTTTTQEEETTTTEPTTTEPTTTAETTTTTTTEPPEEDEGDEGEDGGPAPQPPGQPPGPPSSGGTGTGGTGDGD